MNTLRTQSHSPFTIHNLPFTINRQPLTHPSFLILFAALLWGTTGTAQALGASGGSPLAVGIVRQLVGAASLLVFARLANRRADAPVVFAIVRAHPGPILAAGAGMALYQLTFFAAVARAGVTLGTLVTIGSAPMLVGLLETLLWRQRPSGRWLMATLLSLIGCGLLLFPATAVSLDPGGLLLSLAAGGCYAIYVIASKALATTQSSIPTQAAVFTAGSLLLLPLLFTVDLAWLAAPRAQLMVLHLGAITIGAAYILFATGLRHVPAATAATLSLAEPLTAGLLGTLLLGERLPPIAFAGIGLIVAGLVLLTARSAA